MCVGCFGCVGVMCVIMLRTVLIPASWRQALTVTHHTWVLPAETEEGTGGRSAEPRPSATCSPAAGTQQQQQQQQSSLSLMGAPESESLLAMLLSLLPFPSLFASSLPLRPPQSLSSPPPLPVAVPPPGSSHGPTCAPLKVATFNIWYMHARPQAAATADNNTHDTHTRHTTRTHTRTVPNPQRAMHTTHRSSPRFPRSLWCSCGCVLAACRHRNFNEPWEERLQMIGHHMATAQPDVIGWQEARLPPSSPSLLPPPRAASRQPPATKGGGVDKRIYSLVCGASALTTASNPFPLV
jgi:hypothetical protein